MGVANLDMAGFESSLNIAILFSSFDIAINVCGFTKGCTPLLDKIFQTMVGGMSSAVTTDGELILLVIVRGHSADSCKSRPVGSILTNEWPWKG
jgi:hypothetical protein